MRMRPRAPQSTQNQYTRAHARAPTPPPERYLPVDFVSRWAGTLYTWLRLFRALSPLFFLRSVVANWMHSCPKHGSQRIAILALHILHRASRRLCVQLPRCTTVTTTRALTLYLWEPFKKIGVCFFSSILPAIWGMCSRAEPEYVRQKFYMHPEPLAVTISLSTFLCVSFVYGPRRAQCDNLRSIAWDTVQPYDLQCQMFGCSIKGKSSRPQIPDALKKHFEGAYSRFANTKHLFSYRVVSWMAF